MFFSRPCQHAIRALVHLAAQGEGVPRRVRDIAKAEDLPAPTLASVLQNLVRAGLVRSQKGPRGGFSLARPAEEITLHQIVEAVAGIQSITQCALGLDACSDDVPCPIHNRVQEVRQQLIEYMQSVTVAAMEVAISGKRQHLSPEP